MRVRSPIPAAVCVAAAGAIAVAGRRRLRRVEVVGESMLPALRPGDWLLVLNRARVSEGDAVVALHPDDPGLLIVKRAAHRTAAWVVAGERQPAGTGTPR